jgi:flagellin-specific chaperone FliS
MTGASPCAESVIGSLCREVDRNQGRAAAVLNGLLSCQNDRLRKRLRHEWQQLEQRQQAIQRLAKAWRQSACADALSVEFLVEVSGRPLASSSPAFLRPN